jgi:hypothetical protein
LWNDIRVCDVIIAENIYRAPQDNTCLWHPA